MTAPLASMSDRLSRYDRVTITFHWLTAALVILLFGSAWTWDHVPRNWQWHQPLEAFHVSMGILFAAVLAGRLLWRWFSGRRLASEAGLSGLAARSVHLALYLLLVLQAMLGFSLRWLQGQAFTFFNLFGIPDPFTPDRALAHEVQGLHNWVGWAIVIIAAGHAVAALIHHFVLRDRVLARMAPAAG